MVQVGRVGAGAADDAFVVRQQGAKFALQGGQVGAGGHVLDAGRLRMARAVGLAFGRYGAGEPPQRRQAHAHLRQQHDGEKNNEADDADQQDAVYVLQVVLQGGRQIGRASCRERV